MKVDPGKLKSGTAVKLKDGAEGILRGCYLSVEGIVFTVKTSPWSIADRNVPLADVAEILD